MAGPRRGGGRSRRGRSSVRLPGTIGGGGGCVVPARTW
jgi:hypothetical protein